VQEALADARIIRTQLRKSIAYRADRDSGFRPAVMARRPVFRGRPRQAAIAVTVGLRVLQSGWNRPARDKLGYI